MVTVKVNFGNQKIVVTKNDYHAVTHPISMILGPADINAQDNDLQSDTSSYCPTPLFTEMRKALSDFETGPYDAAPPKVGSTRRGPEAGGRM